MTSPLSMVVFGAFGVGPLQERKMTYYLAVATMVPPHRYCWQWALRVYMWSVAQATKIKVSVPSSDSPIPTNTVDRLRESSLIKLFQGTDLVLSSTASDSE
jgi:hypothetical protein